MEKILRWALGLVRAVVLEVRIENGGIVVFARPYRKEALSCVWEGMFLP